MKLYLPIVLLVAAFAVIFGEQALDEAVVDISGDVIVQEPETQQAPVVTERATDNVIPEEPVAAAAVTFDKKQFEALKTQISDLNAQIESLKSTHADSSTQATHSTEKLNECSNEREALSLKLVECDNARVGAKKEAMETQAAEQVSRDGHRGAMAKVEELTKEVAAQKITIANQSNELEALKAAAVKAKKEYQAVQQELAILKAAPVCDAKVLQGCAEQAYTVGYDVSSKYLAFAFKSVKSATSQARETYVTEVQPAIVRSLEPHMQQARELYNTHLAKDVDPILNLIVRKFHYFSYQAKIVASDVATQVIAFRDEVSVALSSHPAVRRTFAIKSAADVKYFLNVAALVVAGFVALLLVKPVLYLLGSIVWLVLLPIRLPVRWIGQLLGFQPTAASTRRQPRRK